MLLLRPRLLRFQSFCERQRRFVATHCQRTLYVRFFIYEIVESILDVSPKSRDVGVVPARLIHPWRQAADHPESGMHQVG